MKRLILMVSILSPLLLDAGEASKNPEATVSPAALAASAPTITASPNPVPASKTPGTTTINWKTGDGTTGQIYVSEDGGPERLFTAGPAGSLPAPWIQAGKTFEFRLYAGTEHAKLLAKTQVTGLK